MSEAQQPLPFDLGKPSRRASVALLIYMALETAMLIWTLFDLRYLRALGDVSLLIGQMGAYPQALEVAVLAIGLPAIFIILACFVLCGIWTYRAARNAAVILPHENRIMPGWSVGWYFVPIAWFWLPFRAMRQIYNTSVGESTLWGPMPTYAGYWWAGWLISNYLTSRAFRIDFRAETTSELIVAGTIDLVAFPFSIIAALMFRRLILEVTEGQQTKHPHVEVVDAREGDTYANL